MPLPRTRPPRSRFREASMNDRASAAPAVSFVGDAAAAAAERPAAAPPPPVPRRLRLGLVWEGVRGRLRLRRDAPAPAPDDDARPPRDEVLASYHQLVASGFFASHAVHATRRPGPPAADGHPPQWPLAPPGPAAPACSPAAAAARGTKRAAADDAAADDDDDDAGSPLARRLLPKRLRHTASRDLGLPRLRSRRNLAAAAAAPPGDASAWPTRPALRPRALGSAVIVPDANRGIPSVPAIPPKFTFGEDRENDGPWRGLRR